MQESGHFLSHSLCNFPGHFMSAAVSDPDSTVRVKAAKQGAFVSDITVFVCVCGFLKLDQTMEGGAPSVAYGSVSRRESSDHCSLITPVLNAACACVCGRRVRVLTESVMTSGHGKCSPPLPRSHCGANHCNATNAHTCYVLARLSVS